MKVATIATIAIAALAAACTEPVPEEPPPLSTPAQCAPTAGGPYQLVEGETVQLTIRCGVAGETRAGDRFVVRDLPAGAVYDPATATVTWTPGLDQAAVIELALEVTGEPITGRVRLSIADAFDSPGNVPPLDPTRYSEELGVPVIFISPAPRSETYEPITVVYRGKSFAAEGMRRGASSLGYPQLSYTIKFADGEPFGDPSQAGGFLGKRRIVAISTFDDNTYIRQHFAYELWRRMDARHLDVQTYSAVMYIDGAFHGIYTIADHVDKNFMDDHRLSEDANVFKSITHDANFDTRDASGNVKNNLHLGYTKQDGLPEDGQPGAWTDLDDLVRFVATSPAAQFATELPTRFDLQDAQDWFVFVTYTLAQDSGGKNAYLYHDTVGGGPWRYVPWDLNHSSGQAWQTSRTNANGWDDYRGRNKIFARMMDDPALGPALAARYKAMLAGPLDEATVVALFDELAAEIEPVAIRHQRKWGAAYRSFSRWAGRTDFLDHAGEVAYTRQWLQTRAAMIRLRYPAP